MVCVLGVGRKIDTGAPVVDSDSAAHGVKYITNVKTGDIIPS